MARFLAIVLAAALAACQADQKYSQTELSALQTREYDASFETTFDAAVNAMFDGGYVIRSSDRRGGFLSASKSHFDAWRGYASEVVQIKVEGAGHGRTSVRVSTTDGGQQHVNKEQIDEVLNLIDQRLVSGTALPEARR
jgi:hypothetical protein